MSLQRRMLLLTAKTDGIDDAAVDSKETSESETKTATADDTSKQQPESITTADDKPQTSPPTEEKPKKRRPGRPPRADRLAMEKAAEEEAKKPRPFHYRWLKAVDAGEVIVPSSLVLSLRENERGEKEGVRDQKAKQSCHVGIDVQCINSHVAASSLYANTCLLPCPATSRT